MRVRSITCFIDPSYPLEAKKLNLAGSFIKVARQAFEGHGFEVQSSRLATLPFSQLIPELKPATLVEFSKGLEQASADQGYAYVSVGPAMPDKLHGYPAIPEAIAATQNAFFSGSMTTPDGRIALDAIHQCAQVIHAASTISADGFANLRFAALANVPFGSPFFPASYHQGSEPRFALAAEAADLAVEAFSSASSLEQARLDLLQRIEAHAKTLSSIALEVERQSQVKFGGIDFSLAPFPTAQRSLGTALERLGVPGLGNFGSLAAVAFVADTLDRAEFQRAGFNGLFLPVLEDAVLAKRAAEGSLELKDLLLYSAVCGTGLDCVPLPGDCRVEQLYAVLLDVASLSTRLAKPLTARLLPIPGKSAGDSTSFDFAYFANSRVMALPALPLTGLLSGNEAYFLHPRKQK